MKEAEQNAAADRQRREWIDLRNQADGLIYSTERTLEEFEENVSDEERDALRRRSQQARDAMARRRRRRRCAQASASSRRSPTR